tara:strand:+ start:1484 stop:2275 length:792 start_codon:yes stop_codon:yes gene_type:complete
MWTARKLDKAVSKEIDVDKHTTVSGGNYNKHLLAGSGQLARISKLASEIRDWHTRQTLPWSDTGTRLLPTANLFDYKERLGHYESEFDNAVSEFLVDYPQIVTMMAYNLGRLFDRAEYPDAEQIKAKFGLRHTIMPVPESGDFRVDIADDIKAKMKTDYEDAYAGRLDSAVGDAWSRLHTTLKHMAERLGGNSKKIFRDSLIDNALELTTLLTKLNITKDPNLESARVELEKTLVGVSAEDLRESSGLRSEVASKVTEIMGKF